MYPFPNRLLQYITPTHFSTPIKVESIFRAMGLFGRRNIQPWLGDGHGRHEQDGPRSRRNGMRVDQISYSPKTGRMGHEQRHSRKSAYMDLSMATDLNTHVRDTSGGRIKPTQDLKFFPPCLSVPFDNPIKKIALYSGRSFFMRHTPTSS